MSRPQHRLSVPFTHDWFIRRPYMYRYMAREYVDLFFNDGILRLSSFAAFAAHPDEERNDPQEGWGVVIHQNAEGTGQTIGANMQQGSNSYVLCGATALSESLEETFGVNSGFRINDTTTFAHAISVEVPRFTYGAEGPCLYVHRRTVDRDMGRIELESMTTTPDHEALDMGRVSTALNEMAGDDLYFMKLAKYAHQSEYRLLWFVRDPVEGFIDIRCPQAAQVCTRFEDLFS